MPTTMSDELDRTLAALDLAAEHAAAAALARVYADQLDSAAATERQADRALKAALSGDVEPEVQEILTNLRSKLAARNTVASIGPRLAEILGRLLATPKDAGAAKPTTVVESGPRPVTGGSLALLRGGKSG